MTVQFHHLTLAKTAKQAFAGDNQVLTVPVGSGAGAGNQFGYPIRNPLVPGDFVASVEPIAFTQLIGAKACFSKELFFCVFRLAALLSPKIAGYSLKLLRNPFLLILLTSIVSSSDLISCVR